MFTIGIARGQSAPDGEINLLLKRINLPPRNITHIILKSKNKATNSGCKL